MSKHNMIFTLNYLKSAAISKGISKDISKGLKNEFETAVVNEPSVFEPLKFYCKQITVRTRRQNDVI